MIVRGLGDTAPWYISECNTWYGMLFPPCWAVLGVSAGSQLNQAAASVTTPLYTGDDTNGNPSINPNPLSGMATLGLALIGGMILVSLLKRR
jgi:hypothetical protein